MDFRNQQSSRKQIVYFTDPQKRNDCPYDVLRLLLPSSPYRAHNLNFVSCFLNNTPPKKQKFILHWSTNRIPYKAFCQDVLEIVTVHYSHDGKENDANYVIPVPVLLEILGIPLNTLPSFLMCQDTVRDNWISTEDMASERAEAYNKILGKYCDTHGISFHPLDELVKKNNKYMQQMRESI